MKEKHITQLAACIKHWRYFNLELYNKIIQLKINQITN